MVRHQQEPFRLAEAERLHRLREALTLSQRDLAEEFGVTGAAIAQYESGSRTIPGPVLRLIELYEREIELRPAVTGSFQRSLRAPASMAAWMIARSFAPSADDGSIASRLRRRSVERFVDESTRMRGLVMKFAQLLWAVDSVFDEDEREALAALRNVRPTMTPVQAARVFAHELGVPPQEAFAEWEAMPFAVASVGQVHRARSKSGEALAVKIQCPRAADAIEADLHNVRLLDRLSRTFTPNQTEGVVFAEIARLFREECDYRIEARHQTAMAAAFAGREGIVIPRVIPEWSSHRVLTSSFAQGNTVDEFARTASESQRSRASEAIWAFYYRSALQHGAYNTDPNPGNFVFGEDHVAFLDFGRVHPLSKTYIDHWKRLAKGIFERNRNDVEQSLFDIGYLRGEKKIDLRKTMQFLWLWTAPCLIDRPFRFTPAYLRLLRDNYMSDRSRSQVDYSPDMAFHGQLLFGVTGILARLNAPAQCRDSFVDLIYPRREDAPAPYSVTELLQFDVDLEALGA